MKAFVIPAPESTWRHTGIFRYSVYASVAIVLSGTLLLVSVHAYVEYIALHGLKRLRLSDIEDASSVYALEDLLPNYTGAHLGGGTDPAIGFWARNAMRGAWISLHMRKGAAVIENRQAYTDVAVPDEAWLSAEGYLKYAMEQIDKIEEEKGVSLGAAKREVSMQLAEVGSKLAGARGLSDARRIYQGILMDEESKSSTPHSGGNAEIQRLLGEVEMRIINEVLGDRITMEAKAREQQKAVSRLADAVNSAIERCGGTVASATSTPAADATPVSTQPPAKAHWWSAAPGPELPFAQPEAPASSAFALPIDAHPAAIRDFVSAVLSLSLALASIGQVASALQSVTQALDYVDRISAIQPSRTSDTQRTYRSWLVSRKALLQSYAGELNYAILPKPAKSVAGPSPDEQLASAVLSAQEAITSLPSLSTGSRFSPPHPLSTPHLDAAQAAHKAGALAARTRAVLAENSKDDRTALKHYETALSFVETSHSNFAMEQAALKEQIISGIRRTRARLVPAEGLSEAAKSPIAQQR